MARVTGKNIRDAASRSSMPAPCRARQRYRRSPRDRGSFQFPVRRACSSPPRDLSVESRRTDGPAPGVARTIFLRREITSRSLANVESLLSRRSSDATALRAPENLGRRETGLPDLRFRFIVGRLGSRNRANKPNARSDLSEAARSDRERRIPLRPSFHRVPGFHSQLAFIPRINRSLARTQLTCSK